MSTEETKRRHVAEEDRRANVRRLVHEFASYCVWHLSLTKPTDIIALRMLVNDLFRTWNESDFSCDDDECSYCGIFATRFREGFRNQIGRRENTRGRQT